MTSLYGEHLHALYQHYQDALQRFHLDHIIIASGQKSYYFQDDHSHPFHAYAFAQQWLPFTLGTDCFIVISDAAKPCLIWPMVDDFWHAANPIPAGDWQAYWDIRPTTKNTCWSKDLLGKTAWLGAQIADLSSRFDHRQDLINWLNYYRAYKSEFEIAAMQSANKRALNGHTAAKEAFLLGKSELNIHLDYLAASQQSALQEPYPGIVALNEHAAVLHYEHKCTYAPKQKHTLLIDAGASEHGYASDITRTYTTDTGLFSQLITKMEQIQQQLCQQAVAGQDFVELHRQALWSIAHLLNETGLCRLSEQEQIDRNIVHNFFPHGLGHLLGLQVHDVAGQQRNPQGERCAPPSDAPFLRLTRPLETNMVITIEPGLYFIPMLLEKMQLTQPQHGCDLALIQHLTPFGGIRIEDNLVIQPGQSQNLSRP